MYKQRYGLTTEWWLMNINKINYRENSVSCASSFPLNIQCFFHKVVVRFIYINDYSGVFFVTKGIFNVYKV